MNLKKYHSPIDNIYIFNNFNKSLLFCKNNLEFYKIWVIGGKQIYNIALKHHLLNEIYHNEILKNDDNTLIKSDTYMYLPSINYFYVKKLKM